MDKQLEEIQNNINKSQSEKIKYIVKNKDKIISYLAEKFPEYKILTYSIVADIILKHKHSNELKIAYYNMTIHDWDLREKL